MCTAFCWIEEDAEEQWWGLVWVGAGRARWGRAQARDQHSSNPSAALKTVGYKCCHLGRQAPRWGSLRAPQPTPDLDFPACRTGTFAVLLGFLDDLMSWLTWKWHSADSGVRWPTDQSCPQPLLSLTIQAALVKPLNSGDWESPRSRCQ